MTTAMVEVLRCAGHIIERVGGNEGIDLPGHVGLVDVRGARFQRGDAGGVFGQAFRVEAEGGGGQRAHQGGDGGGDHQDGDDRTADLTHVLAALHAGDGGHDGDHHQRDDDHAQQADINIADQLDPV